MKKKQRPQALKVGNRAMNQAFQELRRSSAAEPHRPKNSYRRKAKHPGKGWE